MNRILRGITCKIEWPAACSQAGAQQMENRTQATETHESHSSLPFGSNWHALRCSVVARLCPLVCSLFLSLFSLCFFRPRSTSTESGRGRKQPCCDATVQSVLTAGPTGSAARATDVPARVSASGPPPVKARNPPTSTAQSEVKQAPKSHANNGWSPEPPAPEAWEKHHRHQQQKRPQVI